MTVAVACNLSDGVILGVDSAITLPAGAGVLKVFENGEKLFQLGGLSVGVAAFGLGTLGDRSIGSYLREFEQRDPNHVVTRPTSMARTSETLRKFFLSKYKKLAVPELEKAAGKKFKDIPRDQVPGLGLVVGGFSAGEYLSEVWEILIPHQDNPRSAVQHRAPGNFGTNWFAMFGPIARYIKGYDRGLLSEIVAYLEREFGKPLSGAQSDAIGKICSKYEYPIPFGAMPMDEGVEHTRFLVELVISHHRYATGAPVVGGKSKIGKVTYRGERFQILGT